MEKINTEAYMPGSIVLFGSGETSPSGRKVFDYVLKQLSHAPHLALLETPAGFELNSAQVIKRVAEFFEVRLQNYQPKTTIISARAKGTAFSPDIPEIVAPLLEANLIFMGPGSPTYAVRQLQDSLAWQMILARHRLGAVLALASAATIAVSTYALPVYEIYKVGEDPHWKPGLDFFGLYGLPLVFVPHWNNQDGGEELDTSRCFIGKQRFNYLLDLLPPDITILGIDEKTALIMDIHSGKGTVIGLGGVTLIHTGSTKLQPNFISERFDIGLGELIEQRNGHIHYYANGESFLLSECCPFEIPDLSMGLSPEVWDEALLIQSRLEEQIQAKSNQAAAQGPVEILALVEARREARNQKDWALSDVLRDRIAAQGWIVTDTPQGPEITKAD